MIPFYEVSTLLVAAIRIVDRRAIYRGFVLVSSPREFEEARASWPRNEQLKPAITRGETIKEELSD